MAIQPTTIKNKYNRFLGLAVILFLINVLVFNDANSIMEGAEATNLLKAQALNNAEEGKLMIPTLPDLIHAFVYQLKGLHHFALRLPTALLLIVFNLGFYFLGRIVFGKEAVKACLLVLGSSLLVVNLAKFAINDIWLFAFQGFAVLCLILYLKRPIWKWLVGFWIASLLGTCVSPASMLILVAGLWCYLYFLHPQGKRLAGVYIWVLVPLMYALAYVLGFSFGYTDGFLLRNGWSSIPSYFAYTGIAFLPWLGFLLAGLWDLFQKLKRREELAIINFGWLLLAILSQSLILHLVLAFLTGKQVMNYAKKNYPYENLIKTGALLSLVVGFCVMTILMLQGYVYFQAIGYRSAITVSGVYWVCSFIGVIGLYNKRRDMYIGGMAMSGFLLTLFFWLQLGQLIESSRNLPQGLVKAAKELTEDSRQATLVIGAPSMVARTSLKLYAQDRFGKVEFIGDPQTLVQRYRSDRQSVYLMDKVTWDAVVPVSNRQEKQTGSVHLFGAEQDFWVLR
ncbi:MAG: ArnT family glycosyltransferase [Saprospiraceae bacterium]